MRVLVCTPTYFDVTEKDAQNKYMSPNAPPDREKAVEEHTQLVEAYSQLGISVVKIPPRPRLVDMTFTANCGFTFTTNKKREVILSNFRPKRRRREVLCFEKFFEREGYTIHYLPKNIFFEGAGDALPYTPPEKRGVILLGYGHRTSKRAITYIERITGKEVIPLKLSAVKIGGKIAYHFDITTIILDDAETFITYPPFLTKDALRRLEALGTVINAQMDDALNLCLNAMVITRKEIFPTRNQPGQSGVVVTSASASKNLLLTLKQLNFSVKTIPLTEFLKSGGGALCLTKKLEQKYRINNHDFRSHNT